MQFWSEIAAAGGERYLKSYCFGTNISTPTPGFSFVDYCTPRGLETFEPCSIADFACWPWVVPYHNQGIDLAEFPNVKRWYETIMARPATIRGFEVPLS